MENLTVHQKINLRTRFKPTLCRAAQPYYYIKSMHNLSVNDIKIDTGSEYIRN